MRYFFAFALSLTMLGCSLQPMTELVISPDFSAEQIEDIESAAAEWCERAGACIPVSVGEPANIAPSSDCSSGVGLTDVYTDREPTVSLCTPEVVPFRTVALHELGHALFPESDHHSETGVMRAVWDEKSEHLTAADLALVMPDR